MVKKNQDISIINQETENLNNIKELQDIQKKLFLDLETLASSNDINNPEIQSRISDILNQITQLTNKRNNKIKHKLHCISKYVINYAKNNNVSEIAIGYNKLWKQELNLGSRTNQNFTQIPFQTLIHQLQYKAQLNGINILLNEESYTSKTSAFDNEEPVKQSVYLGKRIKRGLFQTSKHLLINIGVNSSLSSTIIPSFSIIGIVVFIFG